ncbi:MAG: hypothetical protein ACE5EZ_05400, partial [Thermodesulfobacteriota bacterium]
DGPITITPADPLSVTVSLVAGANLGVNADWWALANTPSGWYRYNRVTDSWVPGQDVSYQGPLFKMSTREIANRSGLPTGVYTISFEVDTTMNGVQDKPIFSDSVEVTISSACLPGTDSDGDRLDNCYETNTGVYVSPTDTGTDPNNADTDGDLIDDGDEVLGTIQKLDLPGMGANPLRQDIFLEYDWFDDSLECGSHSHRPTQNAVDMVTRSFANSTIVNPDKTTGITLHNDRGQGGLFVGGNLISDVDGVLTGGVNSPEFQAHKAANFASNRHGYFHYVILPHRYNTNSGSSGQAELPGDDLIVSLYCANSDGNVGHTIMHELGHNLNIRHGGNQDCNYKPNYNSVMNYKYQFPGVDSNCTPPGDGVLDYSVGDRIDLDETALNENLGTCGTVAWDWNSNGVIETGVVYDINPLGNAGCGGAYTVLRDYNDWANLYMGGLLDADGAIPMDQKETISCDNPPPMVQYP